MSYKGVEISNQSCSLNEPKKIIFDNLLLVNLFRVCERVWPVFENSRSEGTDVAIILIFSLAIKYRFGYMVFITSQVYSGSVLMSTTGLAK